MSQTIKLKRSAVAGKVPTTSNLDLGEIALNTNDGKVFFKKDDGTPSIQTIVTTNAQITGSLELTGALTASVFSGSFFGDGSGLAGTTIFISGADETGTKVSGSVDSIFFDPSTGLQVTSVDGSLGVVGIGSHFKNFFVDGSSTLTATGSDDLDLIAGSGINLSTSLTDTNSNGVSKELIFAVDDTIATTGSNSFTGDQDITGALTASTAQIANLKYPTSDGAANTVIGTDGNGNLSFISPSAASAFPYEGNAVITGSLIVSASGAANDFLVGDDKLFVSSNGNVGIGTTSPGQLLSIQSDGSYSDGAKIDLRHPNNNTTDIIAGIGFSNNTGEVAKIVAGTTGGNTNGYISFFTDDNGTPGERVRITSSGNVGIGTTSPSRKLDVNGEINIADSSAYRINDNRFVLYNGNTFLGDIDNAGGNVYIREDGANTVTLSGQNVGIGTTNPSERLVVAGNMSISGDIDLTAGQLELRGDVALDHDGSALYVKAPSSIFFYPGNSNKANINSSGNFTLDGNLDINGTGTSTIDGNLTVGGIVTAQEFHTEFVSASIIYQSGSTKFGDTSDDIHSFSGSVAITGSGASTPTLFISDESNGTATSININNRTKLFGNGTANWGNTADYGRLTWDTGRAIVHAQSGKDLHFGAGGSTNQLVIDTSGNVGIGTTSPSAKLHVEGGRSYFFSGDAFSVALAQTFGQANYAYLGTDTDGDFNVYDTGGSPKLTVQQGGNVGIGTTSPTSYGSSARTLEVRGNTGTGSGLIRVSNADNSVGTSLYSGTGAGTLIVQTNHPLTFATNNNEKMRLDTSGNLGIGTTNPGGILDVQDSTTGNMLVRIWNTDSSGTGAAALRIANSGNNANGNRIEFSDANYYTATISGDRSQGLVFRTSATGTDPATIPERMRIDSSGNVGIGTTSPTGAKLVVAGDISGSGDLAIAGGTVGAYNFNNPGDAFIDDLTVTTLTETSTRELKDNIVELSSQSELIKELQPVTYTWKESGEEDFGLIAEDVEEIAPHLVTRNKEGKINGIKYSKLSVLLLDVVQRQSTLIEDLNERITKLENERG